MVRQKYLLPILALIIANALWGLSTPLIKIGQESIPVFVFVTVRLFFAALILLPFAIRAWHPVRPRQLILLSLAAVLDISLSVTALNYALTLTSASNAGVIWLLMPIIMLLLSFVILKEQVKLKSLVGIFAALIGGVIILNTPWGGGQTNSLIGNALVVLAIVLNALAYIIIKPLTRTMHHIQITFMEFLIGILPIAVYASTQWSNWDISATSTRSWIALAVSIIGIAIAAPLFYYALSRKAVQNVGVYQYIDPFVTVIGAWFLLSERPPEMLYVGAGFIVVGICIVEMKSREPKTKS